MTQVQYDYDDYYNLEELGDELANLRPPAPEGRTTWAYLGFLAVLFVALVGFSWACDNEEAAIEETATGSADRALDGQLIPSALTVAVDGDIVTLRGSVPDEDARAQLIEITSRHYEESSLIDEIVVDPNTTLEEGSIRVTGVAAEDDERPDLVKETILTRFELTDGGTELQKPDAALDPVSLEIKVGTDGVVLLGQVPDEVSIQDLEAAVGALWAAGLVDAQLVEVSELTTWDDGVIRISGAMPVGDDRHLQLVDELKNRIAASVEVDTSAVEVDTSAAGLELVEAEIAEALVVQPILFAPQNAEIDTISDEVIELIAARLRLLEGVRVEVVGHTDDLGEEEDNLALSILRADAVVARLVELGVDPTSLSARGEGESSPLIAEETPEAREQNRRIEFNLSST